VGGDRGRRDRRPRSISVALSADGNTAIAGGEDDNSGVGAAWVYTRSGGVWTQQGSKLVGTGAVGAAFEGFSVALSADGNTAIVGGNEDNSLAGAAWVFVQSAGTLQVSPTTNIVASGTKGEAFSLASGAGVTVGDGRAATKGVSQNSSTSP
jgi:hypothetical protein